MNLRSAGEKQNYKSKILLLFFTFLSSPPPPTQTSLPPRMQQEILQELRTPDRLRETLDVVDIVLGFLSSGGGKADQPLKGYVDQTLKMKRRPFSENVSWLLDSCCRGNRISKLNVKQRHHDHNAYYHITLMRVGCMFCRAFPPLSQAREYCTLGHVLSLWETLSVELARQLTLQGQVRTRDAQRVLNAQYCCP